MEGGYFMNKRSLKSLVFIIVLTLLTGAFLIGCNSTQTQVEKPSDNPSTPPENTETPSTPPGETPSTPTPQSIEVTLYYPNDQASGLVAAKRNVSATDQELIKAIFQELATPPSGSEKPIPSGTKLLSSSVSTDGIATIDLSQEFQTNFNGGSAGEQMTLYSIVNTLTTLPNINSVQFLLAGDKHPGILGHIDTSEPIKADKGLIQ